MILNPITRAQVSEALIRDGADRKTVESFLNYHHNNPEIWKHFKALSLESLKVGRKVGAKCIAESVRYNCVIRGSGEYKVCNTWIAYYARLFNLAVGHDFFDCKKLVGVSAKVERDEIV